MEWTFRFLFIPPDNIAFQAKIVSNLERIVSLSLSLDFLQHYYFGFSGDYFYTYLVKIYFTSGQLKGFPD